MKRKNFCPNKKHLKKTDIYNINNTILKMEDIRTNDNKIENEINNEIENEIENEINNEIENIIAKPKKVISRLKRNNFLEDRMRTSQQILNIIGITETNKTFYSHIIDEDINIQSFIYNLDDEIKRTFQTSSWTAYKPGFEKLERRYLSIIKSVLKSTNIIYTSASLKLKYKGSIINTTLYTIQN